jgi:hypothetical protein
MAKELILGPMENKYVGMRNNKIHGLGTYTFGPNQSGDEYTGEFKR